ncbi:hypothetical protein ACWDKQ_24790 [Saccharopolyspora sp. NPDC000995]
MEWLEGSGLAAAPIFLVYGAANRDPQRFTNPDEVDLERPDSRLEVQSAVGEFVRRNPRLLEDPPPYSHNQIFRGPRHVLVYIDGIRD